MEWYKYLEAFFAGVFLANAVPHFIHGISGNKFPTPFAKPPGKGLSPAYINVIWAAFNMLVGYLLLKSSQVHTDNHIGMALIFAGVIVISLMLSNAFAEKDKE